MQSSLFYNQVSQHLKKEKIEDEVFIQRLLFQIPKITTLLTQLYGLEQTQLLLPSVVKLLHTYSKNRTQGLKTLDLKREQNEDWLLDQKHACMMLYVDHFAEDLKGLEKKIPYFKDLGINVLHLMPLLEVSEGENDGGYAVQNYRALQSRLGNLSDFKKLCAKLRKEGISVVLDFVMNHCADTHEWAIKAKKGDKKHQDYFIHFPDRSIPNAYDQNLVEIFPEMAPGNFTYIPEMEKWVMTLFNNYQWDLNYKNPEVLLEMIENMLFLANAGVDIFRLDAVAYTWKELGTNCKNLPQAHTLLQLYRAFGKVACPGVAYIAEAIVEPTEIVKYFGQGIHQADECDIAYNATLMCLSWEALASKNLTLLYESLRDVPQKPHNTTWFNYIRCHDDIGLGFDDQYLWKRDVNAHQHRRFLIDYYTKGAYDSKSTGAPFMYNPKTGDARISGMLASLCGLEWAQQNKDAAEIQKAVDKINMLHGIILSYGGLPMIYSGDELGMTNDYSFEQDSSKETDNRWLHRPKMDWNLAKEKENSNHPSGKIFQFLKNGIQQRSKHQIFADNNNTFLAPIPNNNTLLSFYRGNEQEKIIVLANFSDQLNHATKNHFEGLNFPTECIDLLTLSKINLEEGILLDPYKIFWLKANTNI